MKIPRLNYSKAKKVNKMECDVLNTNARTLNQKEARAVLRREKQNKWDGRLDYCLSAKLVTALAASCGNAANQLCAILNLPARPPPRLLPTCSWASPGKGVDVLSQFINNCFILVDSKDGIILTFFIADEINC